MAFANSHHSGQLEESPGTGKTGWESQILCSETNVKTEKLSTTKEWWLKV